LRKEKKRRERDLFNRNAEAFKGGLEAVKDAFRFSIVLLLVRADMAGKVIERLLEKRENLLLRDGEDMGGFFGGEAICPLKLDGDKLVLVVDEAEERAETLLDKFGEGGPMELDVFRGLLELCQELGGE